MSGVSTQATGFPPIVGDAPRVLILGSMPSVRSLERQQYYGHPRNAFWGIMAELFHFSEDADYATRTACVAKAGVAIWDVLASCERPGSLDADIRPESVIVNDIAGMLRPYPGIRLLAFNGQAAFKIFKKHLAADLKSENFGEMLVLPSTSPAHAALRPAQKLEKWRQIMPYLEAPSTT